jgi:hypothetical protein
MTTPVPDGAATLPAPDPASSAPDPTSTSDAPRPQAKRLAIVALVLGIAAFVLGLVPGLGILLGIAAVVFGSIALAKRQPKGLAITGLALGIVGLINSIVMTIGAIWAVANYDALAAAANPAPSSVAAPEESSAPEAVEEVDAPAFDPATYAEIDDATFAAIAADPTAHLGETFLLYGEVGQFDEVTGSCAFLLSADNTAQTAWEQYLVPVLAFAASGDQNCAEFTGVAELSHVKLWVTVDGAYTLEFDDGPQQVLGVAVNQVEFLPAL